MKRDLRIAGLLVLLAGLGIGMVVSLPYLQKEDDKPKTIKPKPEPIAQIPRQEDSKKSPDAKKKPPIKLTGNEKKQPEPTPKKVEPEEKNLLAKVEPEKKKTEIVAEPKKENNKVPSAKIIVLGNITKLNDPEGEFTVDPLNRGAEIILLGKIKTLKVTDINDKSLLDASLLEVREIILTAAVNSGSTVKLHAPGGSVEFIGEINDRSVIEIDAPGGKVVFRSAVNSDAKVTLAAKDVDLRGDINGAGTQFDITLTKAGSLKFRRLNGGVRLHYSKADASDPEPRIEQGTVDARAQFRMIPVAKK